MNEAFFTELNCVCTSLIYKYQIFIGMAALFAENLVRLHCTFHSLASFLTAFLSLVLLNVNGIIHFASPSSHRLKMFFN